MKTVRDELGFRYIRFHSIFHDALGTYQEVDGKPVHDWSKIDFLYDQLLAMGIRPFVELGFTPEAMKTSDQRIFHWKGNTSHPDIAKWTALVEQFVHHLPRPPSALISGACRRASTSSRFTGRDSRPTTPTRLTCAWARPRRSTPISCDCYRS